MQNSDLFLPQMHPVIPFDLPKEYARLRAEAPITRVGCPAGIDAWLMTRHADVRAVLSNARFSSRGALFWHIRFEDDPPPGAFHRFDGAAHQRFRRALGPELSARRVSELRPVIERIVAGRLDAMAALGGPVDLYRELALPVPSLVIGELLGVPGEEQSWYHERSQLLLRADATREERERTLAEMLDYMRNLVASKRRESGEDLLSRLARGSGRAAEPFTDQELSFLGFLLLFAGHETTASTIGLAVLALLRHPQQLAALRADLGETGRAVEELLRYLPVLLPGLARYATEDIEVGDQRIRAGEWVVTALTSANRDQELCDRPDHLDLTREPTPHVAFGYGPHQCIGQLLARTEMEVVLRGLIGRFPELQLAVPFEQVPLRSDMVTHSVRALPVTW
ncbi:MAG: cytochrome P450 [Pseudonocardiaceae bacterium]